MTARLEGKCAIVTGAAQGLGRAFSVGLASEGASVVLADVNLVGAEEGASLIQEAGGQAISVHVDGSNPAHTQIMAKTALAAYHRIDILVNNAGIYPIKPWDHITLEEWNHVLAVNLTGPFLCAQAVFPTMQAQGYGKIINISSGAFFAGLPNFLHYVSSKAGLIGFTRALAREVGDHGIRVNAITIGLTQTEGVKSLVTQGVFPEEAGDQMAAQQCIKRREQPEDALGAVIFLAPPRNLTLSPGRRSMLMAAGPCIKAWDDTLKAALFSNHPETSRANHPRRTDHGGRSCAPRQLTRALALE